MGSLLGIADRAFVGFALAAGAEAYFVTLFGSLTDGWEDAQIRAAATIPIMMGMRRLKLLVP